MCFFKSQTIIQKKLLKILLMNKLKLILFTLHILARYNLNELASHIFYEKNLNNIEI